MTEPADRALPGWFKTAVPVFLWWTSLMGSLDISIVYPVGLAKPCTPPPPVASAAAFCSQVADATGGHCPDVRGFMICIAAIIANMSRIWHVQRNMQQREQHARTFPQMHACI